MICPPVCGENLQALASGLSSLQEDNHGITNLYHLHQCRPCRYFILKLARVGITEDLVPGNAII